MINILTYNDYLKIKDNEADKRAFILEAINNYKTSKLYTHAQIADNYFKSEDTAIMTRRKSHFVKTGSAKNEHEVVTSTYGSVTYQSQNLIPSNFFFKFVVQQNQFLLANGLQLKSQPTKDKLGSGFDKTLEDMGELALIHGVSWGFWNVDKLKSFSALEFFALVDEFNSNPMVGIRFWRIDDTKPLFIELYELDGVTVYRQGDTNGKLEEHLPKRAYRLNKLVNAIDSQVIGAENYDNVLPIFPLYANREKRSELTPAIQLKINMFDRIFSDFGENLDRANDVYWVLKNFGGNVENIQRTLAEIEELKAVVNTGGEEGSSAEPHAFEVPYQARKEALNLLRQALHDDYMALDMDALTGGSLTNVAIKVATTNMKLKASRYEWQVFQFIQKLLTLIGIETEDIKFRYQTIANELELMQMLQMCRDDLDHLTALQLNPLIASDEVDAIELRWQAEQLAMYNDEEPDDDDEVME